MIRLDSVPSSPEELERLVAGRCSQFGSVSQVTIHDNEFKTLAWVAMENRDAALALSRQIGDLLVDGVVLIRIDRP